MTLLEMLDALENRVDELLHVNQDLASQLMKSKKAEEPAFGMLFPELGGSEETEELADETAKKKRSPRKKAEAVADAVSSEPPVDSDASPDTAADPEAGPVVAEAPEIAPVVLEAALPADTESPPWNSASDEPDWVTAVEDAPQDEQPVSEEPEWVPVAAVAAEPVEPVPPPEVQEAPRVAAASAPAQTEPWKPRAHPFLESVATAPVVPAPRPPEPPAAPPAIVPPPEPVRVVVPAARQDSAPAQSHTPRPHPFLDYAGGRAAPVASVPAVRPVERVVAPPAIPVVPAPVPVPAAVPAPAALRPVLVPATPSNGAKARHPFAEFTGSAAGRTPSRPTTAPASDVHWSFPAEQDGNGRPDSLRRHMEKAGLNPEELAGALGVPSAALNGWLNGSVPVPSWVLPSVSVLELVTPAARKAARGTAAAEAAPVRKTVSSQSGSRHPFARIEEL